MESNQLKSLAIELLYRSNGFLDWSEQFKSKVSDPKYSNEDTTKIIESIDILVSLLS